MKYSGKIGFWIDDVEIRPGVYKSEIVEKPYRGDITRTSQRWKSTENLNDDLMVNNRISIIADLYLNNHISSIKYITFMGNKWKVSSIEINYPRVIIDMGEVWNGVNSKQTTGTP